ncbi:MAG: MFS transporter [Candidatus Parcubacteria bacterium]|nr:MFS transporter [Candidatus Parcubacteria bacterium]
MKNKNLVFLFIGFLLLFMGFDSSQYYFSSIFYSENIKLISLVSLSLIYLTFAIATFFSPFFCRKLGLKKSFFVSSLFYPLFILSVLFKSEIFIYLASIFLGFAASIIWTAQGTYLVQQTNEKNRGFYSGLFFAMIPLGTSFMVFLSSFFVEAISFVVIYFVLFLISIAGSILLLVPSDSGRMRDYKLSPRQVIRKKSMISLMPFLFSSSFVSGLMLSVIPIRITDFFGLGYVGKIVAIFTFSGVIISVLIGKLSDKYGTRRFVYISSISGIIGFILLLCSESIPLFSLGVLMLSVCYSSFLALGYPIMSKLFKDDLDSAMAIRLTMFSLAVFFSVILSNFLNFSIMILIGTVSTIFSLVSVRYLFKNNPVLL